MYIVTSVINWFLDPFYPKKEEAGIIDKIRKQSKQLTTEKVRNNPSQQGYDWLPKNYEKSIEGVVKFAVEKLNLNDLQEDITSWKRLRIINEKGLTQKQGNQLQINITSQDQKDYLKARIRAHKAKKVHDIFVKILAIGLRLSIIMGGGFMAYMVTSKLTSLLTEKLTPKNISPSEGNKMITEGNCSLPDKK